MPDQGRVPGALSTVAARLRCPACAAPLAVHGDALGCEDGHRFDVGRGGVVALTPPSRVGLQGDDGPMVEAREAFLGAGHFAPVVAAVADAARAHGRADGLVVDVGAGTGRHLAAVLERRTDPAGVALDASRPALRRAVRAHPGIAAVACDVWRGLPVADDAAGVVLNVFAPRNGPEIDRVLAPGGALVVVTPAAEHLHQVLAPLGRVRVDPDKEDRLRAALPPSLLPAEVRELRFDLALDRRDLTALVAMGPLARHLAAGELEAWVAGVPEPFTVTASVVVRVLRAP